MKHLIVSILFIAAFCVLAVPNYMKCYTDYNEIQVMKQQYEVKKSQCDALSNKLDAYMAKYTSENGFFSNDYELGERIALLTNSQIIDIEVFDTLGVSSHVATTADLLYVGTNIDKIIYTLMCTSTSDVVSSIGSQNLPISNISCDYKTGTVIITVDSISKINGNSNYSVNSNSDNVEQNTQAVENQILDEQNNQLDMPKLIEGSEVK